MSQLAERQREFATALLDPDAPIPPGLVGPDGAPSARRFSVYRNNVVVGLTESMRVTYPVVCRVVGEEFFSAMARAFVVSHPPRSPMLLEYGVEFPGFIESFQPAATLPYLADVARIEHAWKEAFHSADAPPLPPAALGSVPEAQVSNLRLRLHPSLRLVTSRYPALKIWRMNVDDGVPAPIDLGTGEEACLIVRPAAHVQAHLLSPGGAILVQQLGTGAVLGVAASAALAGDPDFDLSGALAQLIAAGAFCDFAVDGDSCPAEEA